MPSAPTIAHLHELLAGGLSRESLAPWCGLHARSVDRLLSDTPPIFVTLAVERQVLASTVQQTQGSSVPAVGTIRRIRALHSLGWTMRQIAQAASISPSQVAGIANGGWSRVTRKTASRIVAVYAQMSMRLPPTTSPAEATLVQGARNRAAELGWAPPLAWDDEDLDDPSAVPSLGV